jgi:hypothetical protein
MQHVTCNDVAWLNDIRKAFYTLFRLCVRWRRALAACLFICNRRTTSKLCVLYVPYRVTVFTACLDSKRNYLLIDAVAGLIFQGLD